MNNFDISQQLDRLKAFTRGKPELQEQHLVQLSTSALFHAPSNSRKRRATEVSSQQENLCQKQELHVGMSYITVTRAKNPLEHSLEQLQHYHSRNHPMETALEMLTISNLQ